MIYSYEMYVAMIEWINECNLIDKEERKERLRAIKRAAKEQHDGSVYA